MSRIRRRGLKNLNTLLDSWPDGLLVYRRVFSTPVAIEASRDDIAAEQSLKSAPHSAWKRARLAIYGLLFLASFPEAPFAVPPLSEPVIKADDYYLGRQNAKNVDKALALLREEVKKSPRNYEAWWRISEYVCYLARRASGSEEVRLLEEAIEAGKKAVALQPNRPEGHFWFGANNGLLAEAKGPLKGLFLVDTVRHEMETVARLDPDYEQAGGLRTLARVYYRAPFFKGGDKRRSIELLEQCLKRYPKNSLAMLYLAESYWAVGRRADARALLEEILKLCPDPLYGPEQLENQDEARVLLTKYFHIIM